MVNPQLLEYVRSQVTAGVPKDAIEKNLVAQGWSAQDCAEAFATVRGASSTTPTPQQPITPIQSTTPARPKWLLYSGISVLVIAVGAGVAFASPMVRSLLFSQTQNAPIVASSTTPTTNTTDASSSPTTFVMSDCPNTYPSNYVSTAGAVTITSNPTNAFSIAQGERAPAAGLAAFQTMLTLIANGQGESQAASDASTAVNLQALNSCRMQDLVNAVLAGKDYLWAQLLISQAQRKEGNILLGDGQIKQLKPIAQSSTASQQVANTNSPTTLKTYANTQYGFSFQYPSDLNVLTDAVQPNRLLQSLATALGISSAVFEASAPTTGDQFISASLIVGVSTDAANIQNCYMVPQSNDPTGPGYKDLGTVTINSLVFHKYESAIEVWGHLNTVGYTDYYHLLHNNACVVIISSPPPDESSYIQDLQKQPNLNATAKTSLQQAQQWQAAAPHMTTEFEAILQSFTFTQ